MSFRDFLRQKWLQQALMELFPGGLATGVTGWRYGNPHEDATQRNAFRHAYWNAIMTDLIGPERAKEVADEHERTGDLRGQRLIDREMDLHNNAVGRHLASGNPLEDIERIRQAVDDGRLVMVADDGGKLKLVPTTPVEDEEFPSNAVSTLKALYESIKRLP